MDNVKVKSGERTIGAVPHHFEINVAKDGRHLFGTHERSITDRRDLEKVMRIFREKFPESEGYHVTVYANYEFALSEEEWGKKSW